FCSKIFLILALNLSQKLRSPLMSARASLMDLREETLTSAMTLVAVFRRAIPAATSPEKELPVVSLAARLPASILAFLASPDAALALPISAWALPFRALAEVPILLKKFFTAAIILEKAFLMACQIRFSTSLTLSRASWVAV